MQDVFNNPTAILSESTEFEFIREFRELYARLEMFMDDVDYAIVWVESHNLINESSADLISLRDHLVNLSEVFELRVSRLLSEMVSRYQYANTNIFYQDYLHLGDCLREQGNSLRSVLGHLDAELTRRDPGHIPANFP